MAEQNTPAKSVSIGHELSDVYPKNILWFGIGLALVIGAVVLVSYGLFHYFYQSETRSRPPPSPLSYGVAPPPEPRLLTKPGADLAALRADEDEILGSYGWIDRERGIVRVPIDRAIMLNDVPVAIGAEAETKSVRNSSSDKAIGSGHRLE